MDHLPGGIADRDRAISATVGRLRARPRRGSALGLGDLTASTRRATRSGTVRFGLITATMILTLVVARQRRRRNTARAIAAE